MAISVVQSVAQQGTGGAAAGSWKCTFGAGVTAGNTLVLVAFSYGSAIASSSSPTYNGAAYPSAVQELSVVGANGSSSIYMTAWVFPDIGAGGGTTVGLTGANGTVDSNVGAIAYEVSGLGASPAADKSSTGSGTSGNISSGASGAITGAPELILGASVGFAINQSAATGFTTLTNNGAGAGFCEAGYQIATSSGGSYTWATNTGVGAAWAAGVVTISAGGGGTAHTATVSLTVTPSLSVAKSGSHVRSVALTVAPARRVDATVTNPNAPKGGAPGRHHHRAGGHGRLWDSQ